MSYKVKFTSLAIDDLRNIALTILDLSSDKQTANDYVNGIKEKAEILKAFPECGPLVKDRNLISKDYRFLTYKKYVIFYSVNKKEKTVYVHTIINSRMNYKKALKDII